MENNIEEYSKWLDEAKVHLSNEAIATFFNLEKILSAKEKKFVENHIATCEECKKKFEQISAEDKELDAVAEEEEKVPDEEIKEPVKTYTFEKIIKYSIAAVVGVGLVLATYFSFFQEEKTVVTEKKIPEPMTDTLHKITKPDSMSIPVMTKADDKTRQDVDAEKNLKSFAVNELLENFVHRNVRSETDIEIVQPEIEDTIKFPFTFKWNQKSFSGTNRLIIVNNENKPLYQAEIGGKEITIDQKLASGLYYWKIESNGKLAAIGKFFIMKSSVAPNKNKRSPF